MYTIYLLCTLTNHFQTESLIELGHSGDLTLKSSGISGCDIFQFKCPSTMSGWNQFISVIVDKTISSDEKHMCINITDP